MKQNTSIIEVLDRVFFIKGGHSFWKHLVPFSVAGLLLIVLSLPSDNLLLNLVDKLAKPSWIWTPAALLTVLASIVYLSFLHVQIQQAYLWTDGVLRRSIVTAIFYLFLCGTMAYGVLQTASATSITWNAVWACALLAALSLTGIGWSQPSTWVESLGIQIPNYKETRAYAKRLSDLVRKVRRKPYGERDDVQDFLKIAKELQEQIEKNKNLEPVWAKADVEIVSTDIRRLVEQTEKYFPLDKKEAVQGFTSACNFKMQEQYLEFVQALQIVSSYWDEWKSSKRRP